MKVPTGLKPGLWGGAIGAVALSIFGFSYLGWTTASASAKFAQDTADTAVVAALVPFCVTKAAADPDLATLTKLQAESSTYYRGDIVLKAGWTTFDGKTPGSNALARACADKLYVVKAQ